MQGNYSTAVFDHIRELHGAVVGCLEEQPFVQTGEERIRSESEDDAGESAGEEDGFGSPGPGKCRKREGRDEAKTKEEHGGGACGPVVENDEAHKEAAQG